MTFTRQLFNIGSIAASHDPHCDPLGNLTLRGRLVTTQGGWLPLRVAAAAVPEPLRWIQVRIRVAHDPHVTDAATCFAFIDRVRVGDVEWRSVDAFLESTGAPWGPHLVACARAALGINDPPAT